jgi:TctA family transporter
LGLDELAAVLVALRAAPGSAATAVILAAFLLHGVQPGPLLFTDTGSKLMVYTIFASMFASVVGNATSRLNSAVCVAELVGDDFLKHIEKKETARAIHKLIR